MRTAFRAAAARSAGPLVTTAFWAASERSAALRFAAAARAWRESASVEAVPFGSRFSA